MLDFQATNSGDIMFGVQEEYPTFQIDFFISDYPLLEIELESEKQFNPIPKQEMDTFCINFKYEKELQDNKMRILSLSETNAIKQAAILRIRTELGDMANMPNFGTTLHNLKYKDIRSSDIRTAIGNIVYNVMSDLIDNPVINVIAEHGNGNFYCQNVNIYVYNNDIPLFSFSL